MVRLKMLFVLFCSIMAFELPLKNAQADTPRWEHPRPDFQRPQWLNLNGQWQFDFDPQNQGLEQEWFIAGKHTFGRQINVPFPWEAPLSGIGDHQYKGVAWYQRSFEIPKSWRKSRVLIKFGAVDYHGTVWVNGQFVGEHSGGYMPFEFDITDFIDTNKPNTLTVRAFDPTEPWQPTGKQIHWYTRTSGIWQTVYLEACLSETKLRQVHILPDIDNHQATFKLKIEHGSAATAAKVLIDIQNGGIPQVVQSCRLSSGENEVTITVPIRNVRLWSPHDPFLYKVTLSLRDRKQLLDKVDTYFGMRKISTGKWANHDFEYIYLNNKPIYLIGALNQAFNPDGVYTYPSDEYARGDIEKAKKFGFNFLRLHIKNDEPRLLYWADKLGILLMCDMPNFWQDSTLARQAFEQNLHAAIERDFNHPSIFSWCIINETWGLGFNKEYFPERQEWVRSQYRLAKSLDPTRLVEDMSPCHYDHVETDINSWHFYINDYTEARKHIQNVVEQTFPGSLFNYVGGNRQRNEPLINSEYGGISAGLGDQDISWCFKYLTNELRKHAKIGGYIYTELQDIEWEHNGFMDYDRKDKVFGYDGVCSGFSYRDLNNPDFIVIDSAPCPQLTPGAAFSVDVLGSHFSNDRRIPGKLFWRLTGYDLVGNSKEFATSSLPGALLPFDVVKLGSVTVTLPSEPILGTLEVWFQDEAGKTIARNYINLETLPESVAGTGLTYQGETYIRFHPEDFAEAKWDSNTTRKELVGLKAAGTGAGQFVYHLAWPEGLASEEVQEMELLFEVAAKAPVGAKVDARFPDAYWSRKKPKVDYPQTDATQWPSDVTVSMNGIELKMITLPDDPADARGVLSHARQIDPGSYGYLQRITLSGEKLKQVQAAGKGEIVLRLQVKQDAAHKGGLQIFGHRAGAYPIPPTVVFSTLKVNFVQKKQRFLELKRPVHRPE